MSDVGGAGEGLFEWVWLEVEVGAGLSCRGMPLEVFWSGGWVAVFGRSGNHIDDDATT